MRVVDLKEFSQPRDTKTRATRVFFISYLNERR